MIDTAILESLIPRPIYKKVDKMLKVGSMQINLPKPFDIVRKSFSEDSFIRHTTRYDSRLAKDLVKIGVHDYIERGIRIPYNSFRSMISNIMLKTSLVVSIVSLLILGPKGLILSVVLGLLSAVYVNYKLKQLYNLPINTLKKYAPKIYRFRLNRIMEDPYETLMTKLVGRTSKRRKS